MNVDKRLHDHTSTFMFQVFHLSAAAAAALTPTTTTVIVNNNNNNNSDSVQQNTLVQLQHVAMHSKSFILVHSNYIPLFNSIIHLYS